MVLSHPQGPGDRARISVSSILSNYDTIESFPRIFIIMFSFCSFLHTDTIILSSFTYKMTEKDDRLNSVTIQQKILSG